MPIGSVSSTPALPRTSAPTLQRGAAGPSVRQLQEQLIALGYDCGKADGVFGARTQAAVIAFQRAQGEAVLGPADGKVGPRTRAALEAGAAPGPGPVAPPVSDGFDPAPAQPTQLRRIKQSEVTPAITQKAIEIRNQYARPANYGLEIPFQADGKQYVARIEQHYHEPGGPLKPWGPHAGVSIFAPQ